MEIDLCAGEAETTIHLFYQKHIVKSVAARSRNQLVVYVSQRVDISSRAFE